MSEQEQHQSIQMFYMEGICLVTQAGRHHCKSQTQDRAVVQHRLDRLDCVWGGLLCFHFAFTVLIFVDLGGVSLVKLRYATNSERVNFILSFIWLVS